VENELKLVNVQETLLLPLWGRAVETQKGKPLLKDEMALNIIKSIQYDFNRIAQNTHKLSRLSWIARSLFFDEKIKKFAAAHSDALIINIGCGLDTTFERIDNGSLLWYDLDLPDVIELRKKFIPESSRRKFISCSALDFTWMKDVPDNKNTMIMIAGVLYYFTEEDVKKLFSEIKKHFGNAEVIFDYSSPKGIEIANKKVIESSGMDKSAYLKWGIKDISEIEKWGAGIKIIKSMPMFNEIKIEFPFYKRLGLFISDKLKVMSLAHIRIG